MSKGWVCLHRQLLEWEWYDDINTRCLFIHCLLRANHSDTKWKGYSIMRGQFITSLESLSKETKLSVSQVRTSLNKLISTGELTSKSQARNRVITIVGYNQYQDNDKQVSKQIAAKSQTNKQANQFEIATDNNENNDKQDNKGKDKPAKPTEQLDFSILNFTDSQKDELVRIRKSNKGGKITQRVIKGLAKEFNLAINKGYSIDELLTEWEMRGWKSFKNEWINPNPNMQCVMSDAAMKTLEAGNRPAPQLRGLGYDPE